MSHTEKDPSATEWIPPTVEELHALLPQYEISAVLGQGGMGAVYKGCQTKLKRNVAIKILPESFGDEADHLQFVERFKLEAQSMASLDHPAILSVYDFGETSDGQLYLVMEFIDGMDIQAYLHHHGGKLVHEHAIAITAHVLDALQYAHDHGVVHRDIKPANVLINSEGRVKIADFGLAKRLTQGEDKKDEPISGLTTGNAVMGTPDFVAPEALEIGNIPDGRADLYAVGVMFYQMLTGKLPRGQFELPSELQPELDPRFDAVVSRSLQANPDSRYGSATEFRRELDGLLTKPVPKASDTRSPKIPAAPMRKKVAMKSRLPYPRATPKRKLAAPKKSKAPLIVGLGVVAAIVIALVYFAIEPSDPGTNNGTDVVLADATAKPIPDSAPISKPKPDIEPIPEPTPAPIPEPKPETEPIPEPKPAPVPESKPDSHAELAAIPGLEPRLDTYLKLRREQVGGLADKYLGGLEGRLTLAANAGDLKLARAFEEEKTCVTDLQRALDEPPAARFDAVEQPVTLPELPEGAPEAVTALRLTWDTERQKIRHDLGSKLSLSLKAVETELTNARAFAAAEAIVAYRESIKGVVGTTITVDVPAEAMEAKLIAFQEGVDQGSGEYTNTEFVKIRAQFPDGRQKALATQGSPKTQSLLRFENIFSAGPGTIPSGSLIKSAILRLKTTNPGNVPDLHQMATTWDPAAITFNKAKLNGNDLPGIQLDGKEAFVTPLPGPPQKKPGFIDFDVTTSVQSWSDGGGNFGWVLVGTGTNAWHSNPAETAPLLLVTYHPRVDRMEPTPAPTETSALAGMSAGQEMENALGMKLCWIPAGKFTMGSPEDETERKPDEKQVEVQLTRGFWMGKYEVTQEEFEEVMGSNPAKFKEVGKRAPVEMVSWEMAMDFCTELTERERKLGKLPVEWAYTLPTEAQWEYACRAGERGPYSGGALDEVAWYPGNMGGKRHEVGQKKGNAWGLHDMHGNVWEWCQSWAGPYPNGSVTDPEGPASGSQRISRGGPLWNDDIASGCRSALRGYNSPVSTFSTRGFRVVLVPSAGSAASSPSPPKPVVTSSAAAMSDSTTKDKPFVNSLGMKFVPVPISGGPTDGKRVQFCIWETRVADYAAFIKANPAREWKVPKESKDNDHPATDLSWNDAAAFCVWLTEEERKKGKLGKDQRYRLPTDHEWSCAVGIGIQEDAELLPEAKSDKLTDVYPWGSKWPPPKGAGNYAQGIEGDVDPYGRTSPVGSFEPNEFGLYDLSGNLFEFCEDLFEANHERRVSRGGAWVTHQQNRLLSSHRGKAEPSNQYMSFGFRCVLEIDRMNR